jgi:predicted MFS family arabinose efflux permease
MSVMLIGPPIGVFTGYVITAFMITYFDWTKSMVIIALLSATVALMITLTPAHYVEIKMVRKAIENEQDEPYMRKE